MSSSGNVDPETLKRLERCMVRMKRNSRNLYILSAVMLINVVICAKTDNPEWMVICGITGLFDCYYADHGRKSYNNMRRVLDEYYKKSR